MHRLMYFTEFAVIDTFKETDETDGYEKRAKISLKDRYQVKK